MDPLSLLSQVGNTTRFVPERACLHLGLVESTDLARHFWVGNASHLGGVDATGVDFRSLNERARGEHVMERARARSQDLVRRYSTAEIRVSVSDLAFSR